MFTTVLYLTYVWTKEFRFNKGFSDRSKVFGMEMNNKLIGNDGRFKGVKAPDYAYGY